MMQLVPLLFDYDAVLNSQRSKLYFERRRALAASPEAGAVQVESS
jgi:preprotein translocase subunit SecA